MGVVLLETEGRASRDYKLSLPRLVIVFIENKGRDDRHKVELTETEDCVHGD